MVYGEHLAKCMKCGQSFICGDCIEALCLDCRYPAPNLTALLQAELIKIQNQVSMLQEIASKHLLDIKERDNQINRLTELYKSACTISEQRRQELEKLRGIAQLMSNVCFNLAQDKAIEARHRETMDRLRKQYDAFIRGES